MFTQTKRLVTPPHNTPFQFGQEAEQLINKSKSQFSTPFLQQFLTSGYSPNQGHTLNIQLFFFPCEEISNSVVSSQYLGATLNIGNGLKAIWKRPLNRITNHLNQNGQQISSLLLEELR